MPFISVDAFHTACHEGNIAVAEQFVAQELKGPSFLRGEFYTQQELLVQRLRLGYFSSPSLAPQFQALIEKVGLLPDRSAYSLPAPKVGQGSYSFPDDYLPPSNSMEEGLKRAQDAIFDLLNDPSACHPFLEEINEQLQEYFADVHHQSFPTISDNISSKYFFDGLTFPVPSEDYVGIKKHSALQKVLSTLLNEHDLAHEAYQWFGFIPENIAGESISRGHFFAEGPGVTSLLHGKLSHMLQWAIIILAEKKGLIPRKYLNEKREMVSFSIQEIFSSVIKDNAWLDLFDRALDNTVCFRDPVRLNSYLIQNSAYPALSAAVTDNFCKTVIKNWKEHNALFTQTSCSLDEFIERLAQVPHWLSIPCPPLLAQAKMHAAQKGWTVEAEGKDFAIIKRAEPYVAAPLPTTRAIFQPA